MTLTVDEQRFREAFETYSAIGETENGGLHRLALSDADRRARDQFVDDLESLGLDVRIDEVGNVFGRREGRNDDADPVLIGSHLDSQPYGGRFDGQLGVLCAMETLQTLDDRGITTERPIEIVNWTNEEGARFNLAPLGSGVFVGEYSLEEALAAEDGDGITVREELERIGYDGDAACEPRDYHAHVELHIEQGPKLAQSGTSVGVVTGVVGMAWLRARIEGAANHAGTTPLYEREDALYTAVDALDRIQSLPSRLTDEIVITVGEFDISPGSINIVPAEAEFTLDVRTPDDAARVDAIEKIEAILASAAETAGTESDLTELFQVDHTEFSPRVRQRIREAAADVDADHVEMTSGAGHDAMYVSEIADTAMIFVPSIGGISHNEDEFTPWDDCVTGANVYANAAYRLAEET
jgi:N-carbamoyl-L-amino-acid hydrolase